MTRIRLNRGNLYPTRKRQAGYKDTYFDKTCSGCEKIIFKKESNITIPGKGDFCWDCIPNKMEVRK